MRPRHPYRWALAATLAAVAALAAGVAVGHPGPGSTSVTVTGGVDRGSPSLLPVSERAPAPDFAGIARWFNSPPLHEAALRGRVVLIDFWTFSCVNCTRTIPTSVPWRTSTAAAAWWWSGCTPRSSTSRRTRPTSPPRSAGWV